MRQTMTSQVEQPSLSTLGSPGFASRGESVELAGDAMVLDNFESSFNDLTIAGALCNGNAIMNDTSTCISGSILNGNHGLKNVAFDCSNSDFMTKVSNGNNEHSPGDPSTKSKAQTYAQPNFNNTSLLGDAVTSENPTQNMDTTKTQTDNDSSIRIGDSGIEIQSCSQQGDTDSTTNLADNDAQSIHNGNKEVENHSCSQQSGDAASSNVDSTAVESPFGPVVKRKSRPSLLKMDKAALRKRDSFEIVEEWVTLSVKDGGGDISIDLADEALPTYIENALHSSIKSGIKLPAMSGQCGANEGGLLRGRISLKTSSSNRNRLGYQGRNGSPNPYSSSLDNSMVGYTGENGSPNPNSKLNSFDSSRLSDTSKCLKSIPPLFETDRSMCGVLDSSDKLYSETPGGALPAAKSLGKPVDGMSKSKHKQNTAQGDCCKPLSVGKSENVRTGKSKSFQKRIPSISKPSQKTPSKSTKPVTTETDHDEEKSYGITANHFVTGKSLLAKLKESTRSYAHSLLKKESPRATPAENFSPFPAINSQVPIESPPAVQSYDADVSEEANGVYPLHRVDSFEILEEWCSLSLPTETIPELEKALGSHFFSTEDLHSKDTPSVSLETAQQPVIEERLIPANDQVLSEVSDVPIDPALNTGLGSDGPVSMNTPCVPLDTTLPETRLSSETDSAIGGEPEGCLSASKDGVDFSSSDSERKDSTVSDNSETVVPCDNSIPSNVPFSDPENSTADNAKPVFVTDYLKSHNTEEQIESQDAAEYLIDYLLWKIHEQKTSCDLDALHLDIDLLPSDPLSAYYVFQERNFIQSPFSSRSCFDLHNIPDDAELSDSDSEMDESDRSSFDMEQYKDLSPEAILCKHRVFKEPYFCPSPLQLSTPIQSPMLSPRMRSPLPVNSGSSRSSSNSPCANTFAGGMVPPLNLLNIAQAERIVEERVSSGDSTSGSARSSPRSLGNVSLDSGALSLASSERDSNSISGDLDTPRSPASSGSASPRVVLRATGAINASGKSGMLRKLMKDVAAKVDHGKDSRKGLDLMSPKLGRVRYDQNGRRIVTSVLESTEQGQVERKAVLPPTFQMKTHPKVSPRSPKPVRRSETTGTPTRPTNLNRLVRPATPKPTRHNAGLQKAVSMPSINQKDTDAAKAWDELFAKQQKQLNQLRKEVKQQLLNASHVKRGAGSPGCLSPDITSGESSTRSPFSRNPFYAGNDALKLSGRELEAVTRLNTLCNGKQLAKLITKPTATMIGATCEPSEATRVKWAESVASVFDSPVTERATPDTVHRPILKQRDASLPYPYNDDPITPVVIRKTFRSPRRKTLAQIDPSKVL